MSNLCEWHCNFVHGVPVPLTQIGAAGTPSPTPVIMTEGWLSQTQAGSQAQPPLWDRSHTSHCCNVSVGAGSAIPLSLPTDSQHCQVRFFKKRAKSNFKRSSSSPKQAQPTHCPFIKQISLLHYFKKNTTLVILLLHQNLASASCSHL